jgi:hypothetical protein
MDSFDIAVICTVVIFFILIALSMYLASKYDGPVMWRPMYYGWNNPFYGMSMWNWNPFGYYHNPFGHHHHHHSFHRSDIDIDLNVMKNQ